MGLHKTFRRFNSDSAIRFAKLTLLCSLLLAPCFLAHAQQPPSKVPGLVRTQQPTQVPHIGFLFSGSKDQPHLESFLQGLRDLGYMEGKNIQIEYRYADGRNDKLPALAAELVAQQVAVILTTTTAGNRAALKATSKIPIVSIAAGDPVNLRIAKSLAEPGGNLTGLTATAGPGMMGKRLELLKNAFPKIATVSYLWNPEAREIGPPALEDAQTGARALGLQLRPYEIKDSSDIHRAGDGVKAQSSHALMVSGGLVMARNSKRLAELAVKLRLPAMYSAGQFVEDGGLMAYSVNFAELYRRAASYVDKLLKGRKPAELPIEQPMKFELVINLKAAEQIGVEIAPNVLARADRVIK
jgi:putative ABC transport system substrate-binding protein